MTTTELMALKLIRTRLMCGFLHEKLTKNEREHLDGTLELLDELIDKQHKVPSVVCTCGHVRGKHLDSNAQESYCRSCNCMGFEASDAVPQAG